MARMGVIIRLHNGVNFTAQQGVFGMLYWSLGCKRTMNGVQKVGFGLLKRAKLELEKLESRGMNGSGS